MSPTPATAHLQALRVLDEVINLHAEEIRTHHASCYRYHAGCLALLVRNTLEAP